MGTRACALFAQANQAVLAGPRRGGRRGGERSGSLLTPRAAPNPDVCVAARAERSLQPLGRVQNQFGARPREATRERPDRSCPAKRDRLGGRPALTVQPGGLKSFPRLVGRVERLKQSEKTNDRQARGARVASAPMRRAAPRRPACRLERAKIIAHSKFRRYESGAALVSRTSSRFSPCARTINDWFRANRRAPSPHSSRPHNCAIMSAP